MNSSKAPNDPNFNESNNTSKYLNQKMTELQGEIDKATMIESSTFLSQ